MTTRLKSQAYWTTGPLMGEIRQAVLPDLSDGQVRVQALFSGISRGTESMVAQGLVPRREWARMRCPAQEGAFPFPVKYGYSLVGIVEAGPARWLGRTVFALHPHQTRANIDEALVQRIPSGLPPRRAVLAANMETALNGLWDAGILPGDRVTIVGAGTVGLLVAFLAARMPGVQVTIVDKDERKAPLARRLGCAFASPSWTFDNADLVVEASGNPEALAFCFGRAAFEATILALGWYGTTSPALPLGEDFHAKRLRLISSQVGQVANVQRARWTHGRRLSKALELLLDDRLDALLTGESSFASLPATMRQLAMDGTGTLCHVVRYDEG
ncbi:zinc-dependent alcohol dehydrogenase [Arboricoccus pini]|nr:zinc-binding alcohol dehydrogenase [Arboricoccus pini]